MISEGIARLQLNSTLLALNPKAIIPNRSEQESPRVNSEKEIVSTFLILAISFSLHMLKRQQYPHADYQADSNLNGLFFKDIFKDIGKKVQVACELFHVEQ